MAFDSFRDFILMGGYGFFVWLSFGVSFLALFALLLQSVLARRQLQLDCARQQHRQQRLAKRQAATVTSAKE
ncbi:MAG: heme exporter protein CcmD [Idiomarina sp.]